MPADWQFRELSERCVPSASIFTLSPAGVRFRALTLDQLPFGSELRDATNSPLRPSVGVGVGVAVGIAVGVAVGIAVGVGGVRARTNRAGVGVGVAVGARTVIVILAIIWFPNVLKTTVESPAEHP